MLTTEFSCFAIVILFSSIPYAPPSLCRKVSEEFLIAYESIQAAVKLYLLAQFQVVLTDFKSKS